MSQVKPTKFFNNKNILFQEKPIGHPPSTDLVLGYIGALELRLLESLKAQLIELLSILRFMSCLFTL